MSTKTKRFIMWYSIPAGAPEKSMFLDVETLDEAWDVGRTTVAGMSVAGRVNRIEPPAAPCCGEE